MASPPQSRPRRALSVVDGAIFLIGVVVCGGIFKTLSLVAANVPNEAAFYGVWLLGGCSTRRQNFELKQELRGENIAVSDWPAGKIKPGTVAFIAGDPSEERHRDFVTQAWTPEPIKDVLNRLADYRRY